MNAKKRRVYIFRTAYITLFTLVLIHVISALTLDRRIQYKEVAYTSPAVPAALDGYVIAFVADTHQLPLAELQVMADRIFNRKTDLLLLGGDYDHAGAGPTMTILGRIQTKDGVYGIDGNHDNIATLSRDMAANGIILLQNRGVDIRPGFYLAGVTNALAHIPAVVRQALADARDADFVLLLCHNPDFSMNLDTPVVDLMLSGHTHGGQITFLGLWAPALWPAKGISAYGHKFKSGWAKGAYNTDVYVTNGVGTYLKTPRIFARPQVVYLTLKAAPPEF